MHHFRLGRYGCGLRLLCPRGSFHREFQRDRRAGDGCGDRAYMGLTKIEEIRALFNIDRVKAAFREKYGRDYTDEDVQARYEAFQRVLFDTLENYSEPIPGVVDTVEAIAQGRYQDRFHHRIYQQDDGHRDSGGGKGRLQSGQLRDFGPSACRTSYPYMVYRNMIDLAVPSVDCVLKYGDTIADIKEGVNAKVWTVGVVMGSNELALTQEEVAAMSADELDARKAEVRRRMLEAGAHYVVDDITELPAVIETINQKMN